MAQSLSIRKLAAPSWVRPEALNVTPELLGTPLAPHGRRVAAMAVDLAAIAVLSNTGEFWVAAGIGALVYQLRHRQPAASRLRGAWPWLALALLVFLGAQRATSFVERELAPAGSAAALAKGDADDDDDDVRAARALAAAASAASAADLAAPQESAMLNEARSAARIRELEAQLAEARKPQPVRWRDQVVKGLHAAGRGLGWALAYFTLLPFWWQGQTIGKRLFGLRIVELTGKKLGVMTCFGRYGGYAAAMATGGAGFAQVLWDPNRQAMQDKLAHTVVVDLRGPRAPAVEPAARELLS